MNDKAQLKSWSKKQDIICGGFTACSLLSADNSTCHTVSNPTRHQRHPPMTQSELSALFKVIYVEKTPVHGESEGFFH